MARRGYKLHEFVAHSSNVNCLTIGKKACQRFVTGGDDHNVNLWTIGKPTSLMSLSGHASPVESVAFDSAELSVLAGASSGVVKMWYLEEAKMVRTLSGHKTKCTAVEFHPFGELFASGSMDANLKIWDIRKKECIQTYQGHTQGISTVKFSPDGRWVVSGGFDNIVKVWDLTAGKLLHDFKFHVGHIRSIKFHPLEFLLATGSADKTVKFWDLETFELIGSTRPEATELRAITFHPDGRALFAGLDGGLKVYSWEPMICHDSVDLGWLTLGDLCIHDGKLLACSYYKNSVGVWIADVPLNKPYGTDITPKQKDQALFSSSLHFQKSRTSENIVASLERYPLQSMSPDYETIDIKNIYVDTGGKPESPPVCLKQISNLSIQKKSPPVNTQTKLNDQYSSVGHTDGPEGNDLLSSQRGTVTFTKTKRGMLLKPAHARRSLSNQLDFQTQTVVANAAASCNTTCSSMDSNFKTKDLVVSEVTKKSSHEKYSSITNVQERSELLAPQKHADHQNSNESGNRIKEMGSVKSVNGVTVVPGRTRTLVEKFERREGLMGVGVQEINNSFQTLDSGKEINTSFQTPDVVKEVNASSLAPEIEKPSTLQFSLARKFERKDKLNDIGIQQTLTSTQTADDVREIKTSPLVPTIEKTPPLQGRKFERKDELNDIGVQQTLTSTQTADVVREIKTSPQVPEIEKAPPLQFSLARKFERKDKLNDIGVQQTLASTQTADDVREIKTSPQVPEIEKAPPFQISLVKKFERSEEINDIEVQEIKTSSTPDSLQEINTSSPVLEIEETSTLKVNCTSDNLHGRESQISLRELTSSEDRVAAEGLMESHDIFLSNLRSRMTKLQVVRHFWVQKDIKGAINALMKLPDHSVQTDVISVLSEKMDILTLDLLPLLLPVLIYLLDSKTERHVTTSLEMLLKVVAVFYPVIQTNISAPRIVKVDLQAEQRLQRCNQSNIQIQKIQKILPLLVKKGGVTGKCAQELRMLFEQL